MNQGNKKIADYLYSTLMDRIINLEYPPDTLLSEKTLCEEFKVSRAPVREAIAKLVDLDLVRVLPGHGTSVSPINIDEFRCAIEVKKHLETLGGSLAAKRITDDKLEQLKEIVNLAEEQVKIGSYKGMIEIENRFHDTIYQSTDNRILQEILLNLNIRCARLFGRAGYEIIEMSEVIAQMRAIYEALKERDAEKVAGLLDSHVQYFIDKLKDQLF